MTESMGQGDDSEAADVLAAQLDEALKEFENSNGATLTRLNALIGQRVLFARREGKPDREALSLKMYEENTKVAVYFLDIDPASISPIAHWSPMPIARLREHIVINSGAN